MRSGNGMLVLGAGECGARAALTIRERGYQGSIHLIGDEQHLPYERPPLSKAVLLDDLAVAKISTTEEQLSTARITHRRGVAAMELDRKAKQIVLSDGNIVPYEKLLFATGTRPRKVMQDGVEVAGVHYLRNIGDCISLREKLMPKTRLVVIGGGFLGLEVAAAAVGRGVDDGGGRGAG